MNSARKLILLVDDDEDYVDSLKMLLDSNGFEVIFAYGEEDGLVLWKERNPDLIIVDLMMDDIDEGLSMVRKLKALGNSAPVYMFSSVGDQLSLSMDFRELGLSGLFQKPVDIRTMLSAINVGFARRSK